MNSQYLCLPLSHAAGDRVFSTFCDSSSLWSHLPVKIKTIVSIQWHMGADMITFVSEITRLVPVLFAIENKWFHSMKLMPVLCWPLGIPKPCQCHPTSPEVHTRTPARARASLGAGTAQGAPGSVRPGTVHDHGQPAIQPATEPACFPTG